MNMLPPENVDAENRPNILVITTDQQSHHMMSCAGNQWLYTPAMDRIAALGTRFERAYCANPICVPSRFSMWTGRMPSAIGFSSNRGAPEGPLPDAVHEGSLGHLMRSAGYDTFFAGKRHTPSGLTAESMGFTNLSWDRRDTMAVRAAEFLRTSRDRPWFLAVNFINPHDICLMAIRQFPESDLLRGFVEHAHSDRTLAELDRALERPEGVSEEDFFERHCPPLPANHEVVEEEPAAFAALLEDLPSRPMVRKNWGKREWRLHRWAYHRLTERVDRQIAVLLDALELSGQQEDTVIIFTSDHGDLDGAHRMEQKQFFYDECHRVPLIVAWPGHHPEGVVDKHLCQTGLDLMTTCCDCAGIERPDYNVGLSWRALIEGRAEAWRDGVYGENPIGTCLVTERYKYCHYIARGEEEQLFDLAADPGEMHSLHADPEYRAVLQKHRAGLREEREDHLALQVYSEDGE